MEYLLKASTVIALFYLCFYFFLKKETFFNHNRWFLLIGLTIALLFPFIVIPIYIPIEPAVISETASFVTTIPSNFVASQPEKAFDWTSLLPIIYSLGFAIFLMQFILQFGSLVLLLLKNPKYKAERFTYVIVKSKISPFSFFKWIVFNPDAIEENELNLILTHEKVHAKELHSLDILFTQIACVVFWFNPLIWFYKIEVRQNLEFIADYDTQIESKNQKEYQRLLLKTSVVNHNISLTNNFYNSSIKKRIIMLNKSRSNRKKQWRYLIILPLLACLLMSMNTEEIYVENETASIHSEQTLEFIVTKNTTDDELKAMTKAIEQKGGTLVFSEVQRNAKNELINIFLKLNNHKYGYSNHTTPIDPFIIYKEFFGLGGGYVGRINGATLHYDNNVKFYDEKTSDDLTKRAHKAILKSGIQTKEELKNFEKMRSAYKNSEIDKKAKTKASSSITTESIKVTFTKMTTDKSFKEHKEFLKTNGIAMIIKRLKRNKKGDIIDINIDFETENGATNYAVKDKDGIKSFYFNLNNDGSFGVGVAQDDEVVVVETINANDLNNGKSKNTFNKNSQTHYVITHDSIEVIYEDSTNFKNLNHRYGKVIKKLKSSKENDTLYTTFGDKSFFSVDTVHVSQVIYIDSSGIKNLNYSTTPSYYNDTKSTNSLITGETYEFFKPTKKGQQNIKYFSNQNPKPLIIIDGKEVSSDKLKGMDANHIKSMTVLKGDDAVKAYGEKGKNGVIVMITMPNKTDNDFNVQNFDNYLYILDGKEIAKSELLKVYSKESVSSLKILKDKEATEKYGAKGANGVVIVTSKDKTVTPQSKESPWAVSMSTTYVDEDNPSDNGTFVYISKKSTDAILEVQKKNLEKLGITVKYSKIKRNKADEIVSIKISLKNENGDITGATYKVNEGIPNIKFGIAEGKLKIRTSTMNLDMD